MTMNLIVTQSLIDDEIAHHIDNYWSSPNEEDDAAIGELMAYEYYFVGRNFQ